MNKRASGVLMHITSLPGDYGIGSFGQAAYDFVDFLKETKQTYWQILPLSTTSYGDSPYQSFSAVAGNTHFIDLDFLIRDKFLTKADVKDADFGSDPEFIDYAKVYEARRPILEKAVKAILADKKEAKKFQAFKTKNANWLADYAEFMAIKEHFDNKALQDWDDKKAVKRDKSTLAKLRKELAKVITYHEVVQYLFFSQWAELKAYANENGIQIIGDMPIYISADSVEVWTQPHLFKLDAECKPRYIAGVPPDNFSATGQLWGNPIYAWDKHKAENYAWVPGPGYDLFKVVKKELGDLNIIAEDLGNIDEKTRQLLADCGYPGMKIVQFGFYDTTGNSIDIPHVYTQHSVAYTGTHDNEVVNGWYDNLTQEQRDYTDAYINRRQGEPITRALLRTLFATVSNTAIATMQDILDKPENSRTNFPNTVGENWKWRMLPGEITVDKKEFLTDITERYNRGNN